MAGQRALVNGHKYYFSYGDENDDTCWAIVDVEVGNRDYDIVVSIDEVGNRRGKNNKHIWKMRGRVHIPINLKTIDDVVKHLSKEFPDWPPAEE